MQAYYDIFYYTCDKAQVSEPLRREKMVLEHL